MKRAITLILLFLAPNYGFGQDLPTPVNVIPPSPNAMAMNKFVDVPVSYYTGTPSISVPIYQIQMQQLSLPISLSYHASGLKVEDQASWVGAGWTLNAGGSINRTIRGLPDEYFEDSDTGNGSKGYFHNNRLFSSIGTFNLSSASCDNNGGAGAYNFYPSDIVTTIDSVSNGLLDTEPDLYSFSFPEGSGKFAFNRDVEIIKLTSDDIKITTDPFSGSSIPVLGGNLASTDYKWEITAPNGTLYTFEKAERTNSQGNCGSDISAYQNPIYYAESAWHLTEISLGGESIEFEYEAETITHDFRVSSTGKYKVSGSYGLATVTSTCENQMTHYAQRLKKITTSNGYTVDFIASSRSDLTGSKKLDRVEVKKDGTPILIYILNYDYFSVSSTDIKLKLLSVEQTNGSSPPSPLPGYEFDYYGGGTFPAKNSTGQDFWGYNNGASSNTNLIPPFDDGTYSVNSTGANRNPNLTNARVGTLEKITYPTGGSTTFSYELHSYYDASSQADVNVGGLRVASVTSYDPSTNKYLKKEIEYTSGSNSSGVLFTPNIIGGEIVKTYTATGEGPDCYEEASEYLSVYSATPLSISLVQGNHIGYSEVTEIQKDYANQSLVTPIGKTVYKYINDAPTPDTDYPYVPQTDLSYKNGKLLEKTVYKNTGSALQKVSLLENFYDSEIGSEVIYIEKVAKKANRACWVCNNSDDYGWGKYEIRSNWHFLDYSKQTTFDETSESKKLVVTTDYTYQSTSQTHFMPVSISVDNSENGTLTTEYGRDVTHPSLITSATFKRGTTVLGEQAFTYNGRLPLTITKTDFDPDPMDENDPLEIPVVTHVYGTQTGTESNLLEKNEFPASGSGVGHGIVTSYIWGYNNAHPIAQIVNAESDQVAFSSFEADHTGNWTYSGSSGADVSSPGGAYYYSLGSGSIQHTGLSSDETYIVSYWAKDGTPGVTGVVSSKDIDFTDNAGWTYYEKVISSVTSITISGSAKIDELRLYPVGAEMTTYTYKAGVGIKSSTSASGITTRYEYDSYNRLHKVLDRDGNIIKLIEYSYQETIPSN